MGIAWRSNLYPPSSQRIVQNDPHEESHTHIPHGKSGHDEHHIEIGFLVSDVFYHDRQLRAREKQDHAQNRIGEYLEDDGNGIAEKQGDEDEDTSQDHQSSARLCAEPDMPGHPAGAVTHGNAAEKGRNQVHDTLRNGDLLFRYLPVGKELIVFGNDGNHRIAQGEWYLGDREKQCARNEIIPCNHGKAENRQLEADMDFGQLRDEFGVHDNGGDNPDDQEHETWPESWGL